MWSSLSPSSASARVERGYYGPVPRTSATLLWPVPRVRTGQATPLQTHTPMLRCPNDAAERPARSPGAGATRGPQLGAVRWARLPDVSRLRQVGRSVSTFVLGLLVPVGWLVVVSADR